jgi:endonuclease/exonuclease/phosphatase family metal-dependent hydrolase
MKNRDGTVLAWNGAFEKVRHDVFKLGPDADSAQRLVIAELVHVASGDRLVFCGVHLKAHKECEPDRVKQVTRLIEVIGEFNTASLPVVVSGDFNTDPGTDSYNLMIKDGFKSAYASADGSEPEFTTLKLRSPEKGGLLCRTIDYIFLKGPFEVVAKMSLPKQEDLPYRGLPSVDHYPSDHLLIAADLILK